MKPVQALLLVTLSGSLLFASSYNGANKKQKQSVVKIGQKSTKLLIQTLGKNMKKHMKKGGPVEALTFCSDKAYTLTTDINKKLPKGVSIKRVSLKNRNSFNKPETDEVKVLETFQSMKDQKIQLPQHLIQQVDATTYKFYKPLVIKKKVCLKCHGDITDKKLKNTIAKKYPEDKATGYKMGDIRGAVVVTIKK